MKSAVDRGRAVIVMAKRPAAGRTKTRLTPSLSPQQAADLYEQLLLDTIAAIADRSDCTLIIARDQPSSSEYFSSIVPDVMQVSQIADPGDPGDLGDRLDTVLTACLELGFSSAFALGSDSPDLPPSHLDEAFRALDADHTDVVLGPTEDGGYYLIGWKQRWPAMVRDVVMSTPTVLRDTLAIAESLGAMVELTTPWYDVDTAADLDRVRASLAGTSSHTARFFAQMASGVQR